MKKNLLILFALFLIVLKLCSCGFVKYAPFHDESKQSIKCTHPSNRYTVKCDKGHDHIRLYRYSLTH